MIFCKELNKDFATKQEMFAELKSRKEEIIGLKKAKLKNSDPISVYIQKSEAQKDINQSDIIGIGSTVYAVINTTNFYDSCGDVHLDGIWDISIKDQKGKLYYIINHDLEIGKVIAYPNNVDANVVGLKWSDLGLPYTGSTQALVFTAKLTEATNKDALNAIIQKAPLQNSVRMGYITMILCIDSEDPDDATEKANFDKYIKVVANKDDAIAAGYMWAVSQAKIVTEGSACLFGANEATPILYSDPAGAGQKQKEEIMPEDSACFEISKLLNIF